MNTIKQGLLLLIKSALTGQKLALPEHFTLEAARDMIRSQSLVPLIYPGAINCGISTKTELMQKYQMHYFRHLVTSDRQMRAVEQVCGAFEEHGIDYMLLKGCNLKKLYPKPEMRAMGDADILIRLEQYDEIRPIIQSLQYKPVKESSYDFVWQNADLYLELHKRLFGPAQTDLCGYFGIGWDRAEKGAGCRYELSREDDYVYVFTHMAKHYRICGIGVRHLVDLYVYRKAYPDLNEAAIEKAMHQLQMLDFYRNINRTLEVWFENAEPDEVTELITDYVFNSGSFGTMENKVYYEELTKAKKRKGGIHNSRLGSLIDALFPPMELMQDSYNVLYKWPILLPIYWPIRWIDVLLHRRKNIGKKLGVIKEMTDEKVIARERVMNRMGVTFFCIDDD